MNLIINLFALCGLRKCLLRKHQLKPEQVEAIGCHGQTVWHSPKGQFPFTIQIGDMNLLAAKTGITVVGDLRRKDMAFGGQGAPLVPAFTKRYFLILIGLQSCLILAVLVMYRY